MTVRRSLRSAVMVQYELFKITPYSLAIYQGGRLKGANPTHNGFAYAYI